MDPVEACRLYFKTILTEAGPGMKVLLMDKETIGIVSLSFSQSDMLQKEVYLFEQISGNSGKEPAKYLKCIVFLRPLKEYVDLLCNELRSPRFGSYYIYFSNVLPKAWLKLLAECDEQELVKEVQEIYADFYPIDNVLFSLNLNEPILGLEWGQLTLQRTISGIISFLLATKKNPVIRYQGSSNLARKLAENISDYIVREHQLFDFKQSDLPLLLIVDRRSDPVTPLLNQWTYQAMVHELLAIKNNRVSLVNCPGVSKEQQEVIMSPVYDEFYCNKMYANFGQIGQDIKNLMDDFQEKAKSHQKVESIGDMKAFVENYPQFKKLSGTVSKHVTVVGELSRLVAQHNLLEVSELEQDLAAQDGHSSALNRVRRLITNDKLRHIDALRLVLLYALRYERHPSNDVSGLVETLRHQGVPDHYPGLVSLMLEYASLTRGHAFQTKDVVKMTERFFRGLKGVENVFTQHSPVLKESLENIIKGRPEENYAYLKTEYPFGVRPQDIIVFIIGGVTYEESLVAYQMNKTYPGTRVVIGGTTVHNTENFLADLQTAMRGVNRSKRGRSGARNI
ncbi:vacuolar protein sorting-associated protein 45-like isoform X3 [Artemia franciscana]|nr:EOG090X03QA [Artemia franciscana]